LIRVSRRWLPKLGLRGNGPILPVLVTTIYQRRTHSTSQCDESLGRKLKMRLIEFADPKPHILSAYDARDFLIQLERIWPHEAVAFALGTKRQPPSKQAKLFNALCTRVEGQRVGCYLCSAHRRVHHCAG
jgi:hypothetical protein